MSHRTTTELAELSDLSASQRDNLAVQPQSLSLDTAKGKGGGVRLSADSRTLTLFDLCVALDDDILHPKCALGIAECSDERACPAHALQVAIRAEQLAFLKRTTILSVGEFNARRAGGAATPNDATEPSAHGA